MAGSCAGDDASQRQHFGRLMDFGVQLTRNNFIPQDRYLKCGHQIQSSLAVNRTLRGSMSLQVSRSRLTLCPPTSRVVGRRGYGTCPFHQACHKNCAMEAE